MYYQPSTNMLQLYIVHVYFKILVMSTENLFYKLVLVETSIVSKAVVIGFARLENTDVNTFDLTDAVWSITRFEMLPSALWLDDLSCREGSDSFVLCLYLWNFWPNFKVTSPRREGFILLSKNAQVCRPS